MRRSGLLFLALASLTACHSSAEEPGSLENGESSIKGPSLGDTTSITAPAGPTCVGPAGLERPSFGISAFQDILGKSQFYAQPQNFGLLFSANWTNWYYDSMTTALAKLSTMRGVLDRYNLSDTYLRGARPAPTDCTGKLATRQIDGTCNDPTDTQMGAAGVRFGRNLPVLLPDASSPIGYAPNPKVYPDEATMMTPDPRVVSRTLFTRGEDFKPVPFLNMFAAAWIQFQVHDWFSHGDNSTGDVFRIPLAADDPLRKFKISQLVLGRTVADPRQGSELSLLPPVYKNEVTHWWDASQVYGSDLATSNSLRAKDAQGNLLATLEIESCGLLPKASDGFEKTGMRRNFWVGLGMFHNLFAKEHNAVVAMLRTSHPELDEQSLYDHARLIVAAEIAKIHTIEWTPAILPNPTLTVGMNANWSGLKSFAAPGTDLSPIYGYVSTLPAEQQGAIMAAVDGVVGGQRDLKGVPYSLTEEFVSVYRMHTLLPDQIRVWSAKKDRVMTAIPTGKTRGADGRAIEERYAMVDLLFSFGVEHPGALVTNNYPKFLQELKLPFGIMDMGTVDVLRDRERGLPRYNDFREQLRLKRLASIEEITDDQVLRDKLHAVYGDDSEAINRVDLLVGTMAEGTRPTCYGFGETLFQVFTVMATRRLQADRFFTTDFRAEVYTQEGMDWIRDTTFKGVLLRHHPELGKTGLAGVANAFYPWK